MAPLVDDWRGILSLILVPRVGLAIISSRRLAHKIDWRGLLSLNLVLHAGLAIIGDPWLAGWGRHQIRGNRGLPTDLVPPINRHVGRHD